MSNTTTKCPTHGSLSIGNLQPLDCSYCAVIVRGEGLSHSEKDILKEFDKKFGATFNKGAVADKITQRNIENYLI